MTHFVTLYVFTTDLFPDALPLLHGDLVPPEAVLVVRGERVDHDGDRQRHDEHPQQSAEPASHLVGCYSESNVRLFKPYKRLA